MTSPICFSSYGNSKDDKRQDGTNNALTTKVSSKPFCCRLCLPDKYLPWSYLETMSEKTFEVFTTKFSMCVRVRARVYVLVCVCACVRACVHACVCAN